MSRRPPRIVDAHVHLWDPARTDWYPYLAGQMDIGMGDTGAMARWFDRATYQAESSGWNVVKLVNVAAATGRQSIDETLDMDQRAEADALIGGIAPADTVAEAIAQIDRQMEATRFRGVRPMGRFPSPVPEADVLRELAARSLVFEVLARPEQLEVAARGLAAHDDLVVVIEHTGWPQSGSDEERATWLAGLRALAGLGPNVHCKLSGLSAPAGSIDASPRGWSRPSRRSGSTGASSPATSRWTACTAPSTSSGPRSTRPPPPSTRASATSSSPPTPSASTASEPSNLGPEAS
jgi:L-fuconolactonase